MPRAFAARELAAVLQPQVGKPENARKFSVNIAFDVGQELERIAYEERVSESSVIEIALRQLFLRVPPKRIGAFLKENGACLRRRS